eukprot:2317177-Amphidinium_carterae.1
MYSGLGAKWCPGHARKWGGSCWQEGDSALAMVGAHELATDAQQGGCLHQPELLADGARLKAAAQH